MTVLTNPEANWERVVPCRPVTYAEIRERVGPIESPPQIFGGGHANDNLRLCGSKVLRIYRRNKKEVGKEAALLRRDWRRFRVPHVVLRGADYLVLENVAHGVLDDDPCNGEVIGRALAEIHATRYPSAGTLGSDLDLLAKTPDPQASLVERARGQPTGPSPELAELRTRAAELIRAHQETLRASAGPAVLLHGDFTIANLFVTCSGELLVLDWEFARAGPALADVGQLLRWTPSEGFVDAFAQAYQSAGGVLPRDWRTQARLYDLANLLELLAEAPPATKRAQDLTQAAEETLSAG